MTASLPIAFFRNRLTWLAYAMLAYIGFSQAILGPLMPFLRSELGLTYTQGGFLPAAIASGLILTGLLGGWLARRLSRRVLFWGGGAGLALSIVALSLSLQFGWVLFAILGMGLCGSLAQVMIQAILSDQHGEQRAIALTEANVAASLSATLTPVILSSLQRAGVDWRAIALITLLLIGLLAAAFWRETIPDKAPLAAGAVVVPGNLPFAFWLYWLVLFLMVAAEMSLSVWSTDFLVNVARFSRTDAVLAFGAFPAAMLLGRFAGSRLTRRWPARFLLFTALILSLLGFPLFWLARVPALNVLGLFITGLGIANQYPLTMSVAVGLVGEQTNQASARITLAVGAALLSAPLVLGRLADRLDLQSAFGIVPVLLIAALLVSFTAERFRSKKGSDQL